MYFLIITGNIDYDYRSHNKIKTVSPTGIRRVDHREQVHVFHGRMVKYPIDYYDPIRVNYCDHKVRKGVRKDNILLCEPRKPKVVHMLSFSRPCLCGSFLHSSTRSLYCLLNKKYLDD